MSDICHDCLKPFESHDGPCRQSEERVLNEERAADIVDLLSTYVNQGRPAKFLVAAMARQHRTLQQCMTAVVLQWLVHLSGLNERDYDPRNEKSVKVAKAIKPVLVDQNVVFPTDRDDVHLPCI